MTTFYAAIGARRGGSTFVECVFDQSAQRDDVYRYVQGRVEVLSVTHVEANDIPAPGRGMLIMLRPSEHTPQLLAHLFGALEGQLGLRVICNAEMDDELYAQYVARAAQRGA